MTVNSWLWVGWLLAFGVLEAIGLVQKDAPGKPRTLSAQVWWLIRGAGTWHHIARVLLVGFLAWLSVHMVSGGWA